jgi:hypothetical protein
MQAKVENYIKSQIFSDLEQGRPNFDLKHTEAVVHNMKEIIGNISPLQLLEDVLIISAYAHDWGYADLYRGGYPIPEYGSSGVKEFKRLHMEIGAKKVETLLKNPFFDYLSKSEKERIVHLVHVHDIIDGSLANEDELTLIEADTLGALDVTIMTPTMDRQTNAKWMVDCRNIRFTKFTHDFSKQKFEKLYDLRMKYYENLSK